MIFKIFKEKVKANKNEFLKHLKEKKTSFKFLR